MRIVYVTGGLPYSKGETFIIEEILELRRRGHIMVVLPLNPLSRTYHRDAERLIPLTRRAGVLSPAVFLAGALEFMRSPTTVWRAWKSLFESRNLRILAKNVVVFAKGLWIGRVARSIGAEHIHAHWASTSATGAFVASQITGIPWSFTAHRWDIPEDNLIALKAESAQFVRAIDMSGGIELAEHMGTGRKPVVIHMGVAIPARKPPQGSASAGGRIRIVMAAYFFEKKGHRYAFEAIRRLKERGVDVRLECVGDGTLRPMLETLLCELEIGGQVSLLGAISHDDLLSGLAGGRWDMALLPSIDTGTDKEGIPVFLIEAMAAGLPVIGAASGGIPELLEGEAGILVPQRDALAIADAVERWHSDRGWREKLRDLAEARIRSGYAIEGVVDQLEVAMSQESRSKG